MNEEGIGLKRLGLDPYQLKYPHLGLNRRLIGPDDEIAHLCEGILAQRAREGAVSALA